MSRSPLLRASTLAVVLAASCAPADSGPSRLLAENEVVARSLMAAWERGDVGALADAFWPDATYDDFSNSVQHRGVDEIAAYFAETHGWASDVVVNVTAVHASEAGAVAEWVFSAVQTAPLEGTVDIGTGREVVLNGVTILEIQDGLIRRGADYVDTLPLVLQLGGRVEMPGGTTLEVPGG